jgi:hypothetical protein
MKLKLLLATIVVLAMSTVAYAQAGFAGKWSSDAAEVAATEAAMRAPRNAPVAPGGPGAFAAVTAFGSIGGVQMDLAVSGNKVSGTITQGGMTIAITDGIVEGKKATLKSQRAQNGQVLDQTWTAEMKDDNTFVVTVTLPYGGPHDPGAAVTPVGPGQSATILPVTLHRAK